ncbi:sugar transporter [Pedobacter psychrophilus]|uniref:Sugar transporter n=1 Tax=Pedobacter psychrophilus TaxID=1826909 RepID=A0A179DNA0_9SPHI|nr:sugar transporter [Pedobacter psychrophilus]
MIKTRLFFLLILFTIVTSCGNYKQIPYFQNLKLSSPVKESIDNYTPVTIQKDDILGIYITSSSAAESNAPFNNKLNRINGNNEDYTNTNPINPFEGYLVDDKGEIQFPVLGTIKVAGLTTTQLRQSLKEKLTKYLNTPVVNARIVNFKISVLGDVAKPDVYSVKNERITILEALSLAGDLTITAKRNDVLIIREQNGERQYVPVNLNSKDLFKSDYYYLKSNDVIYVQPSKTKYAPYDIGYRNATLIVAALSVVAIVLSTIYR